MDARFTDRNGTQPFPAERTPPPPPRPEFKLSPDELRVLKECNRESFYGRCLPLSALFGTAVYYGVKSGYLKPNPTLGATPKVLAAVVVGFFMGKFSYQNRCAEKLMALPNSRIGEMLRQKKRGLLQESMEPRYGASLSLQPFVNVGDSNAYSDLVPPNTLDMDTSRPLQEGLDDSLRPSVDNPITIEEEEVPEQQKHITTYDELRKKNREEYMQKRTGNYREQPRQPPPVVPDYPVRQKPMDEGDHAQRNQYGDIWT